MNYCLERIHATQEKDIYGIMMDVNCFKEINDTYAVIRGAGDQRAIQDRSVTSRSGAQAAIRSSA